MASGGVHTDASEVVGLTWLQFGAYHMDRCEALGSARGHPARTIGIEVGTSSDTYEWPASGDAVAFTKHTLFPDANVDRLSAWSVFRRLVSVVRRYRIRHLILAGYEQPGLALAAVVIRAFGVRVYVALDSKFDDKPRRLRLELVKRLLMLPYHGGFASGPRSADYLRFLGLRGRPIALGYDAVGLERLRRLAPPGEVAWEERAFLVVARFVPKKNLPTALRAYASFRMQVPHSRRRLRLCGAGPDEVALRAQAEALGITGSVDFCGFVDQVELACELSRAICLMLPSDEEQWGLVVNEALAFELPVLVSEHVGARDVLVGTFDNGFVLDALDSEAWASAMRALACDRDLWERMRAAACRRAPRADVEGFVAGVEQLVA